MKVSRYKDIIDSLSRYASSREKAQGPSAAIGVQSDGNVLKLISGTETAGMIVSVREDVQLDGRFVYIVGARSLLESAKVLSGKDTVSISATSEALTITASGGGKLVLKAEGAINDVGFPKKPKGEAKAEGDVRGPLWGQLSRIIPDIAGKIERPSIHTGHEEIHISIVAPGNRPRYASVSVPSRNGSDDSLVTELDFWEGVRALQSDGTIRLFEDGVLATDGESEVYSRILQREFQWPVLGFNRVDSNTWFTMERSKLTTAIRGQASGDEFNRVTVDVSRGMVTFKPFNKNDGLSIPCSTSGEGTKSFNADYMKSLLSSMIDTKHVTLEWGVSPAINVSAKEYQGWTMLVAPVALG